MEERDDEQENYRFSLRTSGKETRQQKEITCSEVTAVMYTSGQKEEMHRRHCTRVWIDGRVLLLVEDEKDVTHCPALPLIGLTADVE